MTIDPEPLVVTITGTGVARTVILPDGRPVTGVHRSCVETTACKLLLRGGYDTATPVEFINAHGEAYLTVPSAGWVIEFVRGRRGAGQRELADHAMAFERSLRGPSTAPRATLLADLMADLRAVEVF